MRTVALVPLLAVLGACSSIQRADGVAGEEGDAPAADSAGGDRALLWEEAVSTFDGSAYTYRVLVFPSESAARACHDRFVPASCRQATLSWREVDTRSNEIPLPLREHVLALSPAGLSDPFPAPTGSGWLLVDVERQKPSKFVGAVDPQAWLAKYAATALPRPRDLRTDPVLVARRARNRVRTSADLAAALESGAIAPAQLDDRLSNGATLLLKAIYLGDRSLVESLLASGARADKCGLSACPLTTAVLLRERDAVLLLLEYVHAVEELIVIGWPAPGAHAGADARRTVRLSGYDGPGLAVLMGVMPPLGTATDLFQPLRFTLRFRP
ncbi:ankyrin repeat domain-containing protein [Anaeromyxobacter oryzae]|uniref:Ankyrin repeat domain-containing protein n=1 Tax=Anaeromyxobacter oryzae TaxID=2918170 RepID=A0ABM7WQ94_9BACT|nr:ankyrin repeat domain-containing protein [Anaeromyxobacter oryzae]BDG01636.1 hypothetical protein AMOR_06320 [Anaeromyxobacter oryzae]